MDHDRLGGLQHPVNSGDGPLELQYSLKSRLNIESVRLQGYLQNLWSWDYGNDRWLSLVAGVRAQYWTYNGQTVVSPRARVNYRPGWHKLDEKGDSVLKDISFWFATGYYYQPPFYRELRMLDGTLNPDIRAQRSVHFLLGMDRVFPIWGRPFKLTAEAYYKYMDRPDPVRSGQRADPLLRGPTTPRASRPDST